MMFDARACTPDVYVHVPKTAGSSLRKAVIDHYGATAVWVYDMSSEKLFRSDKQMFHPEDPKHIALRSVIARLPSPIIKGALRTRELLLASSPETAFKESAAMIGHFAVDAFDDVPAAQDARWFTVVRDPLDRAVSHYRYLQQNRGFAPGLRGWMDNDNPDLSFADFALSNSVQNFQTRYTGTDPSRFTHIGTTEAIGDFMVRQNLIEAETDMPRVNQTTTARLNDAVITDPGFRRNFEEFHSLDYTFYNAVAHTTSV